ncbi:MAG TPA: hypothetical protein VI957_03080 [Candidatus Paceibacterota bacterium]
MNEARSAETTPEIWRTPREWADILARASVIAEVRVRYQRRTQNINVPTRKIGYKAGTIEHKSFFYSHRKNGEIPSDLYKKELKPKRGNNGLFAYSRSVQVQELHNTLNWICEIGIISSTDKDKWAQEAERLL